MKFRTAFVTGATGLLGNNLVRALLQQGFEVRALARSRAKAERQFAGLDVSIVEGDLADVDGFRDALIGVEVVFHTAAYFRDSFLGGSHWAALYRINVTGTHALMEAAYAAGVRRFAHTSSVAVLDGEVGQIIDETMLRSDKAGDDYYRSKVLTDQVVLEFLAAHDDFWAALVLPGWMFGPGDIGPTSSGKLIQDFARGRVPVIPPGTFPFVDARDVAEALIQAERRGRRGERYIAAGRHMNGSALFPLIAEATGTSCPTRVIPLPLFYLLAAGSEAYARITGKSVALSWATARAVGRENEKSRFDHSKSERELGLVLRPVEDTLRDEVGWYREHGYVD